MDARLQRAGQAPSSKPRRRRVHSGTGSGLVLLNDLDLHVAVVGPSQRDQVRPAADRAVLGERLVTPSAQIDEDVVLGPAERAIVRLRRSSLGAGYAVLVRRRSSR